MAVVSPCRVGMEIVVLRPAISGKRTPDFGLGSIVAANRRATESATNGVDSIDTDSSSCHGHLPGGVNARWMESIRHPRFIYEIDDNHLKRSLDSITTGLI